MPHWNFSLPSVLALVAVLHLSTGLPVSQNHRFALYTPYWSQASRDNNPYWSRAQPSSLDCAGHLCNTRDSVSFVKRNKHTYKSGWTMGGLPFSVLYMNPKNQMSLRSPAAVAEPLHSILPSMNFDPDEIKMNDQPMERAEDLNHEVQAQALISDAERVIPTMIPTRRQYSIIPQLFVSYGWGPLGK